MWIRAPVKTKTSSMASKVEVLCPNGRRQNVKITPNTKILQILEEVCTKQDFLPTEDYELKHGRKSLDVTLSVRYAGLPNLAKLELIKSAKKRAESEVTIALQLESGERLQGGFLPGVLVWDVLQHWEGTPQGQGKVLSGPDGTHPVCIYMREEIVGSLAMQHKTLRQLGLTGGRAILRITHRQVDEETLRKISDEIEKEKVKRAKLSENRTSQGTNATISSNQQAQLPESVIRDKSSKSMEVDSVTSVTSTKSEADITVETKMETDEKSSSNSVRTEESMDTGSCHSTNSNAQSMNSTADVVKKAQSAKSTADVNKTSSTESQASNGESRKPGPDTSIPGMTIYRPGDMSPEEVEQARRLAEVYMPGLLPAPNRSIVAGVGGGSKGRQRPPPQRDPNLPQPMSTVAPFADFKFPEATKGKEIYKNELSEVNKEEYKPCDRETVLFSLDEQKPERKAIEEDIPDDFFEVTEADVRRMYTDMQKSSSDQDGGMLLTSAMRKAQMESRMDQYPRVVIRVHFPDRMVLQALFRPRETVFALQKYVKTHLEDPEEPFYLYTTPPRCVLKDKSQNLFEAKLAPMAVVHFGSERQKDHYLSPNVEVSRQEIADRIVYEHMGKKHIAAKEENSKSQTTSGKGKSDGRSKPKSSSSTSKDGEEKKVPKWFMAGKK